MVNFDSLSLVREQQRCGGGNLQLHLIWAYNKFGEDEVTKVVANILAKTHYDTNNILESMVSLAVDESVHLEGVFTLLREITPY